MSPLRKRAHKRLREPFGKAGLTVAILALVMALVGGAYAAGGLSKSQEKQVTKIAKKYAGKPGAPGAAGTNGTNGTSGKDGVPGAPGKDGANGKSVVVGTATSTLAGECPTVGGATVEVEGTPASKKKVCNGKDGSPWTAGGTLPSGSTETGAWSFNASEADGGAGTVPSLGVETVFVPISFPIPLAGTLGESEVHFATDANFSDFDGAGPATAGCKGTPVNPTAPSGHLCVYVSEPIGNVTNATLVGIVRAAELEFGASKSGSDLVFKEVEDHASAFGTWAVTG